MSRSIFDKELNGFENEILESTLEAKRALHSVEEIISWFTQMKLKKDLRVDRIGIDQLENWIVDDDSIYHKSGRYFRVLGVKASIDRREVASWCQPLVEQRHEGIIGFIIKKIDGVQHFLIQAKLEPGNFDIVEMAPTVQCMTGSYKHPEYVVPYLNYFTQNLGQTRFSALQSEEGGRFYQEQNLNIVIEVDEEFPVEEEEDYIWMTMYQIKEFIKFNNYFNIEARSLVSCISVI